MAINRWKPRGTPVVILAIFFLLILVLNHFRALSPYYTIDKQKESPLPYKILEKPIHQNNRDQAFDSTPIFQYVEVPGPPEKDLSCAWAPESSKILLIMKTGASESFDKIPTQLMTTLRCTSDFLLFSDMKQTMVGVDIHDSLETVLEEAVKGNPDFDLYRRQNACVIDQESCSKNTDESTSSDGWNLDKYKNIHIAEKAYRMRPGYDWYITVDADTYVLWPNLVQWISTLDPSKKHYLGSVAMLQDMSFGHGGSGYILSRAAMEEFVGNNPGVANKYDVQTKETCCGDYMLAIALKDVTGMEVENAWPTLNGEKPFTLPFGPGEWCHPVVTMHHMNSEDISAFWEFEKRFYEGQESEFNRTLLLKDIYKEFLEPRLEPKREDWDNLSEDRYYLDPDAKEYEQWQLDRAKTDDLLDTEMDAHKSFDDCAKMCNEVEECFQFRFQNGICAYQRGFLLGRPKEKEDEEDQRWISGWAIEKIKAWINHHQHCDEPIWPSFN